MTEERKRKPRKEEERSMLSVYEFEVFEHGGVYLALPYDMTGGTQGDDFKDACESAADWLQLELEHRAMRGIAFPDSTFDNEPRHGGRNVVVAVNAGTDTVPKVLPSEAARMLGVSPGRVTQMMDSGQLEWLEEAGKKWVTVYSVEARLAEQPKAGRPRKEAALA